jgi:hypothetical protein
MTWKLQRSFYDVRYEPRAVAEMQVPESFAGLWQQRRRWATGLIQVLKRNAGMLGHWRSRRLWPVFIEAVLSVTWAYTITVMIAFWSLSYALGLEPLGANPVPNFWGMVIASVAIVQLAVGTWLDRHYNPKVARFFLWAPIYPLFYWGLMTVITVISTPKALFGRPARTSHWKTSRVPAAPTRRPRVAIRPSTSAPAWSRTQSVEMRRSSPGSGCRAAIPPSPSARSGGRGTPRPAPCWTPTWTGARLRGHTDIRPSRPTAAFRSSMSC